MWELDYKKSWALKNWCFCTVVLEKTLESPLDSKKIQPVHPEGNQSWMFIGRTGVEAEAPKFWPLVVKNWLIGKDSDARKDWRQEDKGTTRGWDGWMASPTQWTWAWVNSGSWWWTGRPGMLQSMGPQRVRHDWVTELNWILEFLVTVGKKKKKYLSALCLSETVKMTLCKLCHWYYPQCLNEAPWVWHFLCDPRFLSSGKSSQSSVPLWLVQCQIQSPTDKLSPDG